jgi:tRNA A-37 threonylcarbamoyl transferase component Bud32
MKICIVAAGLATRLQPLTNYIPKFLINIGKQTGFVEMIRYWSKHSTDFTIIIHPMYFKDSGYTLTIKTCETALGTAHTIDTSLGNEYTDQEVLFTWCDVIPSKDFELADLDMATMHGDGMAVFTVNNGLNRYKFEQNTLIQAHDGDVIGIYYVENYKPLTGQYVEGQDFADVLSKNFLNQFPLEGIIDFGDKEKLFEVLKTADEGREFNSIEIFDNFVHKKALNEQGKKLLRQEFLWYQELHQNGIKTRVPKVYIPFAEDEMIMERVNGVSMYKVFSKMDGHQQMKMLDNVDKQLKLLASEVEMEVSNETVKSDIHREAHGKLINRYNEIKQMIDAFGTDISVVNGLKINTDVVHVICELTNELWKHYADTDTYQLIHGDLQMSNTMVNPRSLEVTLIDPRGYFGDTKLYGLQDYDKAKMLYALTGYDLFNYSTDFHIKNISSTEIEFDIPSPLNSKYGPAMLAKYEPVHYLWLAVIWLGLAQYIKNNPVKSLAAHYHGLYLATKFLNKDFTL